MPYPQYTRRSRATAKDAPTVTPPSPSPEVWHYAGLRGPTYTQMPDDYLDHVMAHVSANEWKVLSYVARRTFGFKKDSDRISLDQICNGITRKDGSVLDEGTGLPKASVVRAVAGLVDKGIIAHKRHASARHGHVASSYHVVFRAAEPPIPLSHDETPLSHPQTRREPARDKPLVSQRDTQQTGNQQTAHKSRGRSRTPRATEADYGGEEYRSGVAYKQGKYGHLVE